MKVQMTIPGFSGFYESIWSSCLDDETDMLYQDGFKYADRWHYSEKGMDGFADDYAVEYLGLVNQTLGLHLSKLDKAWMCSPREYNFTTDKIWFNAEISESDLDKVVALMKEHREELRKVIKEHHSSYDGFISFMSNDVDEWIDRRLDICDELGLYLSYAVHYLLGCLGVGEYDEEFYDWSGYEWANQVMEYEPELIEENEKYRLVMDAYGEFDGEKWDGVDVRECERICRQHIFDKEHQLSFDF